MKYLYKKTKKADQVKRDLDNFIENYKVNKQGRKPARLILSASQIDDLWYAKAKGDKYWRNIPCISQKEAEHERADA